MSILKRTETHDKRTETHSCDLISQQDVIDELNDEVPCTSISQAHENDWIPVSERLPEREDHTDEMVLVCYGNGSVRFNTCMNGEWVQGNPIAWMPLPEAYKEGEMNNADSY